MYTKRESISTLIILHRQTGGTWLLGTCAHAPLANCITPITRAAQHHKVIGTMKGWQTSNKSSKKLKRYNLSKFTTNSNYAPLIIIEAKQR